MRKNWVREEDEILKKYYPILPLLKLPEILPGRNINAIKARQTFLRICKQYTKDNNFFSIPNTLNSSIAGFIASDGHISPAKSTEQSDRLCFGINSKDHELLVEINSLLKSNYCICKTSKEKIFKDKRTNKTYNYIDYKSSLHISSVGQWKNDLFKNWNIPAGAKNCGLLKFGKQL